MNFSSIVYLEAIGVHLVGSCGHSWPHYISQIYCKQLYTLLKKHVLYLRGMYGT